MKNRFSPLPDTTLLPDIGQRRTPIPHIGVVIGTSGTPAYIRLQLHSLRAMHEDIPILVVNDGDTDVHGASDLAKICEEYGAYFQAAEYLGHSTGDLRAFELGIQWAVENNIQILAKFSRRFVPLVPWRHQLICLADQNHSASVFGRLEQDRLSGMLRTDAIALRVSKWNTEDVIKILRERAKAYWKTVNVESIIKSIVDIIGPIEEWDLIGPSIYRPWHKAIQWRGVFPDQYADYARSIGLNMKAADFREGYFGTVESQIKAPEEQIGYRSEPKPLELSNMVIVGVSEEIPEIKPADKFPLVTSVDDRMVEASIKLLRSVEKFAKGQFSRHICLYRPESLCTENLKLLEGCGWEMMTADVPELPKAIGTVPEKVARLRSKIPDLLPNEKYALYLDSDMILVSDITEAQEWPIWVGNNCVGAVFCTSHENYYNSGFMLMNLDVWRKFNIGEQSLSLLHDLVASGKATRKDVPYDENVLNSLFQHYGVTKFPGGLNVTPGSPIEPNENNWRIVHFRGPKPWNEYGKDHPMRELMVGAYNKYADLWRAA